MPWKAYEDWPDRLQEELHRQIANRGLSASQACKKAGIDRRTIRKWGEIDRGTGKQIRPSLGNIIALCQALGISPSTLFRNAGLGSRYGT